MKKLKLDDLIPGMVTAEDVYNYNDQLVLSQGIVLTPKAISKLEFYGIYQVRVKDEIVPYEEETAGETPEEASGIPPSSESAAPPLTTPEEQEKPAEKAVEPAPAPVSDTDKPKKAAPKARWEPIKVATNAPMPAFSGSASSTTSYMDKMKSSEDFKQFKEAFDEEVQDFKSKINEVVLKNAPLDVNELLDDALDLVSKGQGTFSIFDMLHSMRQNDDETYAHCLNVGLFCNVFAGWLKLSEDETRIATLCGLLCDIGKMKISDAILRKPDTLNEAEMWAVKKHAYEGYQLVRNLDIDNHIKNAVLTHHERCDGSGYPFGLRGSKIDPYARMVAIADVYDAMTSVRPWRNAMSPFQAVQIMQDEGLQKYDVRFIMTFLENVMNTFIGNRVLLSNGEKGEIVYIHKNNVTRPTLKCGGHYVDMNEDKEIQIVAML